MFTLDHPKNNESVLSLVVAQGTCDLSITSISGRAISRGTGQPILPVQSFVGPKFWALWFFGLAPDLVYDLEIRDQDRQVVIGRAANLAAIGRPAGVTIMYPQASTSHCSVVPYGTTSEPDTVPMSYIKLCPGDDCTNGINGQESFRFNGYWSVSFSSVPHDTYTLKVGHNEGGAATKQDIEVGAC